MSHAVKFAQWCLSIAFLLPWSGLAQAGFITSLSVDVTPQAGGLFSYNYTLTNQASSDLPAVGFSLDVASTAALSSIAGPAGWTFTYSTGDTSVTWESPDVSTDLLPGVMAAFSFLSPLDPGQRDYLIVGFDEAAFRIENNVGQVASPGPNAAPEPTSLVLLGLGGLCLLAYGCTFRDFPNREPLTRGA